MNRDIFGHRWCELASALTLGLAAVLLPARQAQAQTAVIDLPLYMQQVMGWAGEVASWAKELENWQAMVSSLNPSTILGQLQLNGSPLQQISDTDRNTLISQTCPGPGVFNIVNDIASFFSSGLTGNIAASQQKICQQITFLQIDKYNRTVVVLNQINSYGDTINKIKGILTNLGKMLGGDTLANITNQMNTSQQNMSALNAQMQSYQSSMAADDAAISALQQMQSNLAAIALHGQPSLLGTVVKAATFAAAFSN